MSNLTLPDDSNRINETERAYLKQSAPSHDWDNCSFCDDHRAEYISSSNDYLCYDCWVGFESYMNHAWGTCLVCQRALNEDGSCKNCEYEGWKSEQN